MGGSPQGVPSHPDPGQAMNSRVTEVEGESRPVVSFLLFTYNQEAYVREAVLAALAQDHAPLEVIISDDASSDGTFAVIEEVTRGYDGPHRLIVRRNAVNRGWISHVNEVSRMAKGEWIVMAAGDDVSSVSRVSNVVELAKLNPTVRSIFLGFNTIGEAVGFSARPEALPGRYEFPDTVESNGAVGLGATQAWKREIFEIFGPLPDGLHREDAIIPFRASLMGGVLADSRIGVTYRISENSLSRGYFKKAEKSRVLAVLLGERQEIICMLSDLEIAHRLGMQDVDRIENSLPLIRRMLITVESRIAVLAGTRVRRIAKALAVILRLGESKGMIGNLRFRVSLLFDALS